MHMLVLNLSLGLFGLFPSPFCLSSVFCHEAINFFNHIEGPGSSKCCGLCSIRVSHSPTSCCVPEPAPAPAPPLASSSGECPSSCPRGRPSRPRSHSSVSCPDGSSPTRCLRRRARCALLHHRPTSRRQERRSFAITTGQARGGAGAGSASERCARSRPECPANQQPNSGNANARAPLRAE